MKRILAIFMAALLLFALSACGGNRQSAQNTQNGEDTQGKTIDSSRVLIAYFSVPEAVDTSGTDAIAGASIVVKENNTLGNVEYTAETIQETVGGDLLRIETAQRLRCLPEMPRAWRRQYRYIRHAQQVFHHKRHAHCQQPVLEHGPWRHAGRSFEG
jgi:hypothetical protein